MSRNSARFLRIAAVLIVLAVLVSMLSLLCRTDRDTARAQASDRWSLQPPLEGEASHTPHYKISGNSYTYTDEFGRSNTVTWEPLPRALVRGQRFRLRLRCTNNEGGHVLASWLLTMDFKRDGDKSFDDNDASVVTGGNLNSDFEIEFNPDDDETASIELGGLGDRKHHLQIGWTYKRGEPSGPSTGPIWVRASPPEGARETKDPRITFGANSVTFTDQNERGHLASNTITWEPLPERVAEGDAITLRLTSTKNFGAPITAYWGTSNMKFTGRHWVDSFTDNGQESLFYFTPRYAGPGYENIFVELKDSISQPNRFRIHWNYKREAGASSPRDETVGTASAKALTVLGDVRASTAGGQFAEVNLDQSLPADTEIRIAQGGGLILELPDKRRMTLRGPARLRIKQLLNEATRKEIEMLLHAGEAKVEGSAPGSSLKIETPVATTTDKRTTFTVNHDEQTNATTVTVEEGEVLVTPADTMQPSVTLTADQRVEVTPDGVGPVTSLSGGAGTRTCGLGFVLLMIFALSRHGGRKQ